MEDKKKENSNMDQDKEKDIKIEDEDTAAEKTEEKPEEKAGTSDQKAEEKKSESKEAAEGGQEKTSDKDKKEDGPFFKKKKKDKKDEKIDELTDRVRRQMAEFDNFRKRTEKEKSQMFDMGVKSMIEKVLPVVDNFERGLASVPEDQKDNAIVEGMDKIYKQLLSVLEETGVKPIEAVGKEFDPNLHNAVMHIDDDSFGENIVAEEFQKGYTYKESVVRHSMVKVAN